MTKLLPLITLLLGLGAGFWLGQTPAPEQSGAADAGVMAADEGALQQAVERAMPDYELVETAVADIAGMTELYFGNGQVLLGDNGGAYVTASVYLLKDGDLVDVLAAKRQQWLVSLLERENNEGRTVNFTPEQGAKRWVAVFTDPACGYCRKLHNEMQAFHDLGIEVRYLAMPTVGGQKSMDNMASAWCKKDSASAMHTLKTGGSIEAQECGSQSTIRQQAQLGSAFGFRGTPGIVLDNGQTVPGYRPAKDLARAMGIAAPSGS